MLQLSLFEERVTDAANSIVKEHSSKLYNQLHTVAIRWTARFLCRYNFSRQCLHITGREMEAARPAYCGLESSNSCYTTTEFFPRISAT